MMDGVGDETQVGQDCEREKRGILGLILISFEMGCERNVAKINLENEERDSICLYVYISDARVWIDCC
jgi:hypothetical protein